MKKSISVTVKLLKLGGIVGIIAAITAGIVFGICSSWETLVSIWNEYVSWGLSILTAVGSFFAGIPWFVYIILAIPACIVGYSYLWCWNRQNSEKIQRVLNKLDIEFASVFLLIIGFTGFLCFLLYILIDDIMICS